MATNLNMTGAIWRKSSYSGDTGGECVECAPLGSASWRKSSYSGSSGGDCVEVARLTPTSPSVTPRTPVPESSP